MAHVRKQIRDYVATLLTGYVYDRFGIVLLDRSGGKIQSYDSATPTGSIYRSRYYAIDDDKLPAIVIYTDSDSSQLMTIGTRHIMHNLELRLDIINKGSSSNIFENVEQLSADMVRAIENDYDFGGLIKSCELASMNVSVNFGGEKTLCTSQLAFRIRYVTELNNCEVSI